MLSQLVDGLKIEPEMREDVKNSEVLKIVLGRIGNNLSDANKKHILELIQSPDIVDPKYDSLIYFLYNLLKIYDQQRKRTTQLKNLQKSVINI